MVHLQGADMQADSRRYIVSQIHSRVYVDLLYILTFYTQLEGLMQRAIGMTHGLYYPWEANSVFLSLTALLSNAWTFLRRTPVENC